jgi:hypothetical protein
VKIVDVYRDLMYDTIVLYLAVFPEIDLQKRYVSIALGLFYSIHYLEFIGWSSMGEVDKRIS